jgi:predicted dehydrogenase
MQNPIPRRARRLSRRSFIQTSVGASVIAASSSSLSGRSRRQSAGDAVGVGFIGVGIRGEILIRATQAIGGTRIVEVADVYDGHFDRAREIVGPSLRTGRDYRKLLDNQDVQAVVISVPDHWHHTMAIDAMAAGKDVYLEKPMTHRWQEGPPLIEAARKQKRILQIGSQWESNPANDRAIELIRSGRLGRVTLIDGRIHRNTATGAWYYPIPPDASERTIDWARFLGPAPQRPFDARRVFQWRLFWDYSGGLPTDLFVHLITATHTLMNVRMASRVTASGGVHHWKDREVPDQMSAIVEYPEGFTLTLTSTAANNHRFPPLTIMGTEGTLEFDSTRIVYHSEPILENYTYSTNSWPQATREKFAELNDVDPASMRPRATSAMTRPEPEVIETPPGPDSTERHLGKFYDSVRSRTEPVENGEMGHLCATVGHMVNLSYRQRREMLWDSASQKVVPFTS